MGASGVQQDLVELVERPSPPPDSALALRQGTAGSVKRLQANGMKPTIIEDSETSDEDAIIRLVLYLIRIYHTRKYLLCGYILGVLTHTTAWDQLWGGDETLKSASGSMYMMKLGIVMGCRSQNAG